MVGGGIDMLALFTFPPTVPTSATLLFLLVVVDDAELVSREWEGVRGFAPVDGPFDESEESFAEGLVGSGAVSCRPISPELISRVDEDTALSRLVVRDNEAMTAPTSAAPDCCT